MPLHSVSGDSSQCLDVPYGALLNEAAAPGTVHLQPKDVPVHCHVLHPPPIQDFSLFVDLNLPANQQGPIVFRLPPGGTRRHRVCQDRHTEAGMLMVSD
jgi:hypothetical protein